MTRVLFFGHLADRLGRRIDVPVEQGTTAAALRQQLVARGEAFRDLTDPRIRVSVDQVIVGDDHRIGADAEVAFLPILSGG